VVKRRQGIGKSNSSTNQQVLDMNAPKSSPAVCLVDNVNLTAGGSAEPNPSAEPPGNRLTSTLQGFTG
jgi:hypothetical protein